MKKLTYIAPLCAGKVLGVLYGTIGLIIAPILFIIGIVAGKGGAGFALLLPVLYFVGGFVGGVLIAALYNWTARWTGGFEVQLIDANG